FHYNSHSGTSGLPVGAGKATKEVLIDAAKNILGPIGRFAHRDPGDKVDQFAHHHLVEGRTIVVLGQHALESFIRIFLARLVRLSPRLTVLFHPLNGTSSGAARLAQFLSAFRFSPILSVPSATLSPVAGHSLRLSQTNRGRGLMSSRSERYLR